MNKKELKKIKEFKNWMRNTIKNIYYLDEEKMSKAYQIILENDL